jgi:anti-sigma regulatory factor (Ser/Thr protein kinase)
VQQIERYLLCWPCLAWSTWLSACQATDRLRSSTCPARWITARSDSIVHVDALIGLSEEFLNVSGSFLEAERRPAAATVSAATAHTLPTPCWTSVLKCQLTSARRARELIDCVLTTWGYPEELVGDASLVVSELVTNACVHGSSDYEQVGLGLAVSEEWLTIMVSDHSPRMPIRRAADADEESGRGLMLVEALGSCWGAARSPGRGKVVWVRLDAPIPVRLVPVSTRVLSGRSCPALP